MSIFADGVHPSTDELRAYGTGRLMLISMRKLNSTLPNARRAAKLWLRFWRISPAQAASGGRRIGKFGPGRFRLGSKTVGEGCDGSP